MVSVVDVVVDAIVTMAVVLGFSTKADVVLVVLVLETRWTGGARDDSTSGRKANASWQ